MRRQAMRSVIDAHPDVTVTGRYSGRFSVHSGEDAAASLLEHARGSGGMPDAVVCSNDQMAIGVLRALAAAGVRVPRDVAVVGFDDIFPASLCDPPLTTVHQPIRLLGERACERLIDRIADPSLRRKVELLPTELVIRSSCGCPAGTSRRQAVRHRRPLPPRQRIPESSPDGSIPPTTGR
jgi:LacI family transcriptional regulator